jgi:hypothetical protein
LGPLPSELKIDRGCAHSPSPGSAVHSSESPSASESRRWAAKRRGLGIEVREVSQAESRAKLSPVRRSSSIASNPRCAPRSAPAIAAFVSVSLPRRMTAATAASNEGFGPLSA